MFSHGIDLIQMVRNAGFVVQLVLAILLFFSIFSWAIIFIKSRHIRRAYRESAHFIDYFWKSGDLSDAYAKCRQFQHSPIARVFRTGYLELRKVVQKSDHQDESGPDMGDAMPKYPAFGEREHSACFTTVG